MGGIQGKEGGDEKERKKVGVSDSLEQALKVKEYEEGLAVV